MTVGPWIWQGDRGSDQAAHLGVKGTKGQGQGGRPGDEVSEESFLRYTRHRLVPSGS